MRPFFSPLSFLHGSARDSLSRRKQARGYKQQRERGTVPKRQTEMRERATFSLCLKSKRLKRKTRERKNFSFFCLFPFDLLLTFSILLFYALLAKCSSSLSSFPHFVNSTRFVNGRRCSKKQRQEALERTTVEESKASFLASSRWSRRHSGCGQYHGERFRRAASRPSLFFPYLTHK